MKKLIKKRSDGIKESIKYNQWGKALGEEGNHFASMVGSLARNTIPIDIDNYGQVSYAKKNSIWETVQVRVLSVIFN